MLGQVTVTSLGYRTDLMIRRLEGSRISERDGYLVIRTPAHPGFWWGNFLLLARPPRGEEVGTWLARFAEEFPRAGHVALGVDVTSASSADPGPYLAMGFTLQQGTVMTATAVQEPPHPSREAEIRVLAGDADWDQSLQVTLACYSEPDDVGQAAFIRERAVQKRALTEAGHGAWFGAFVRGRLACQAGLVWGGGPYARYQDVETHPAARRQGLAGTLLWQAGLAGLRRPGVAALVIVAEPEGDAARVYRRLGFTAREDQLGFQRPPPAAVTGSPARPG